MYGSGSERISASSLKNAGILGSLRILKKSSSVWGIKSQEKSLFKLSKKVFEEDVSIYFSIKFSVMPYIFTLTPITVLYKTKSFPFSKNSSPCYVLKTIFNLIQFFFNNKFK